ncbi:MAG: DUF5693 family protein, partial [bacterium]
QKGADRLAYAFPGMTAKVHSIEDEEMEIITPERAVARYLRAVRERAVRIVYLKPFLLSVDRNDLAEKSLGMFKCVRESLEQKGFAISEPSIIVDPVSANFITRLFAAIACAVGFILLLLTLNFRIGIFPASVIALIIIVAGIALGWIGTKLIALGLAVVSPTLAIAWLVKRYDGAWRDIRNLRITQFWPTIMLWSGSIGITVVGALLIGSSMINTRTLLEIDAFSGVKIALYLPILLALIIGVQLILPAEKQTFVSGLEWLFNVPVKIWHVLLGFVALVALFIMLDRSGNFPIISVADWENNVRGWLETAFYARPRTKEVFIGHPALILGLYLGLSNLGFRRYFLYAGVVIGSIALTSLTNTFCHMHTPIVLSVFRTASGAIIGAIIGLIAGLIIGGIINSVNRNARPFTPSD